MWWHKGTGIRCRGDVSSRFSRHVRACERAAHLGHHRCNILHMSQGDQLDSRGRNGHRPVAQQAVQEVAHVVLGCILAVDVQRLEHRVWQTLQETGTFPSEAAFAILSNPWGLIMFT